jgi:hypothetical protein
MSPKEIFKADLTHYGFQVPDLSRLTIKEDRCGLIVNGVEWNPLSAVSARFLLDKIESQPVELVSNGRRWRCKFSSDDQSVIQKQLCAFGLPPFVFTEDFDAREENGRIIVGAGIYEQWWVACDTRRDCEAFLRRCARAKEAMKKVAALAAELAAGDRLAADESNVTNVKHETSSEEVQRWFKNMCDGHNSAGEVTTTLMSFLVGSGKDAPATPANLTEPRA